MNLTNIQNINKIIILRLSSMGDVILTSPVIRLLRKHYPEARIDFVTTGQFSESVIYNPYLSNVFIYDKSKSLNEIAEFRASLASCEYDLVVDLHRNNRTRYLRIGLANNLLQVKKNRLKKLSLVYLKTNLFVKSENNVESITTIPEIYIDSLHSLNIVDDEGGIELWLPEEMNSKVYPPELSRTQKGSSVKNETGSNEIPKINRIAIAPGAHHFTKRYPVEKFSKLVKELIMKYKCEIILVGGVKDIEFCKEIRRVDTEKILDFSGSESIIETARLIDKCDLLITNDTGVMHIASARRVPVVAIFGSSVKEFGFLPYKIPYKIVETNISCRPCSHIGRSECPKGHFNCMNLITTKEIMDAINKLMN